MDKPDFEIRSATKSDLPAIHRVREAAFAPIFAAFRSLLTEQTARVVFAHAEEDQGRYLDTIANPDQNRGMLVALIGGRIVGFCGYALDEKKRVGTIDLNGVDPQHSSRGIGTALYQQALEIMRRRGMQAAQVSTGADASHVPARRAYKKVGLVEPIPSVLLCRTL